MMTGFIQKIATIFPGLFKDQIEFSRTTYQECNFADGIYKCTFPVTHNRFLRLQVFAPSPSLHLSVHLQSLFCLLAAYLHLGLTVFEVALHRKRISNSMQSNLLSTPQHLKLKKIQGLFKDLHRNSRTFQGLPLKFKDLSRLCKP